MLRSGNLVRWTSKAYIDYIKNTSTSETTNRRIYSSSSNSSSSSCCKLLASSDNSQEFIGRKQSQQFTLTSGLPIRRSMSEKLSEPKSSEHKFKNRLSESKSPYLLQHAHNPVDWYPWGEEAIEKAKRENKPIFLSVGYSTCHWCHVMEKESFENEAVAELMNKNFINIKVDREERPDIDKIYMQFVMLLTGRGGWPMSVWLTPDLTPITGGTYFPPNNRYGVPSFSSVLKFIAEKWQANPESIKETGATLIEDMQNMLCEKGPKAAFEEGSADAKLEEAVKIFKKNFNHKHGGFGNQPKFPECARLNFLFHAYIATKDNSVLDMALMTLSEIGKGGIHDHIFGGFARYAVDNNWHVPHFEKMLYDQGQLLTCYANAFKLTGDDIYLKYADGIFRYLQKDLRHPKGGFYSGEDADSLPNHDSKEKIEGAFYAWEWKEIEEVFKSNASLYEEFGGFEKAFQLYSDYYNLKANGNVEPSSDPHGHLLNKNILIVSEEASKVSSKHGLSEEQLGKILEITNEILHKIRDQRPRPHLDTKIICAWNGLVLSGLTKLANCGSAKREEYMQASHDLIEFIKTHLYNQETNELLRSCYGVDQENQTEKGLAEGSIDGFLDDYAFLIKGLLDYYKASLDGSVLKWAKDLQDKQDELFWDDVDGAYYYSKENSPNVVIRLKDDHDGAEPSGNSVAARNLILLSHYFDDEHYKNRADKLFNYFANSNPFGYVLPEMMSAFLLHEHGLDLVAVVGPDSETTKRFVEICRKFYIPGMIIVHVDPEQTVEAVYSQRVQQKFKMVNGKPTVYICHDKVCRMPVTDPEKLQENLMENFFKPRR